MKKVEIKQFSFAEVDAPKAVFGFMRIPVEHKLIRAEGEELEVSDGYHTFDELYEHRIQLFIALCKELGNGSSDPYGHVWRSKVHSDGSSYAGWYLLCINREPGKQISYHLPDSTWEQTNFAETLEKAPEFDGHTSADVLDRIKTIL